MGWEKDRVEVCNIYRRSGWYSFMSKLICVVRDKLTKSSIEHESSTDIDGMQLKKLIVIREYLPTERM